LLALRRVATGGGAQLVGTNVHISCGLEVASWREHGPSELRLRSARCVELRLRAGRAVSAPRVWLYLPGTRREKPPLVMLAAHADGAPEATDAPPLPQLEYAGDGVWVVSLAPIRCDGLSSTHEVRWQPC
jgi:hypothetical protein